MPTQTSRAFDQHTSIKFNESADAIRDSETGPSAKETMDTLRDTRQRPFRFSTSGARAWSTYDSFSRVHDVPFYQKYSIVGSIVIFLLYFCILREENDIDEALAAPLFNRVQGLEELTLTAAVRRGQRDGADVSKMEQRLREIQEEKKAARV